MAVSIWAVQNQRVQTYITQKIASHFSKKIESEISIESVKISFFNKLRLNNVVIYDQQTDTLLFAESVAAKIDSLKIKKRNVKIGLFEFNHAKINIKKDSINVFNFSHLSRLFENAKDTANTWNIACNKFMLKDAEFVYNDNFEKKITNIFIKDIFFDVNDINIANDSISLVLSELKLNDGKQLQINNLTSKITYTKNHLDFKEFNFETQLSKIENASVNLINFLNDTTNSEFQFDARLNNSKISLLEVAEILPVLRGMNQTFELSGRIYGNLDDLKGKNLQLSVGKNTSALFDFYLNDIANVKNMYLFIDMKRAETNFSDVTNFKLPNLSKIELIKFPEAFYDAGQLVYKGNFSGFLSDFVAFGTFTSQMGTLTTDLSVVPEKEGITKYQGKIATTNFKLNRLIQNNRVGILTFNGNVDGTYNKNTKSVYGNFLGYIDEFEANNYVYKNIVFDGILDNRKFDGLLSINDPNLKFNFSGQMNLNPEIPVFDFHLNVDHAFPGVLNFSKNFPLSEVSFDMVANFEGNKLDNLTGKIEVNDGIYKNRNGDFTLKGIQVISERTESVNHLDFKSDFFDINIEGEYNFQSIINVLKDMLSNYSPAFDFTIPETVEPNIFGFQINVKNLDQLTKVFVPDYKIETPFLIYGEVDSKKYQLKINGSLPGFSNSKFGIRDIFIGNSPTENGYTSKFRFGEIRLKNNLALYNLLFDTQLDGNNIHNKITWTNYHDLTYSGNFDIQTKLTSRGKNKLPRFTILGAPSLIHVADSVWNVSAFNAIVDSSSFKINNFTVEKGNAKLLLDGEISANNEESLSINFENIRLSELQKYLQRDIKIKGIVNGSASVTDFYNQRFISSDLNITDFYFNQQQIGNISLKNTWNKEEQNIQSLFDIKNNNSESFIASGTFDPKTKRFDYFAKADNLSLVVLESVLGKSFSNIHGDGSGHIRVSGTPSKIYMDGAVYGENAGLTIDYTKVSYHFTDSVYFKGDTIHFNKIKFFDANKNSGIFDGILVHDNFKNMRYALNARTSKITAINTVYANNEQFFGRVVASGSLDITGQGNQIYLSGTGTTLSGTSVNISLDYESEIEQYDFIEFVEPETIKKREFVFKETQEGGVSLDLTIEATSEARAQLIYNSQIGDVIKAQGEGILKFGMDKEGNITLAGNYTIERGDYLFTLQNVINKRFSIEQGGSLVWSGDPYTAIIDINAVYKLKASLYDLLVNSYEDIYQNQRIPVECKIILTENLSNPEIDFQIVFPTVESRIIDELQQYFSTKEEMNKQILSLLVLGKFYTPEYMRGTYEAQNPNVLGTTASELFSNQLSNWLSQINNNIDVGLNYRPGNQITNDEIELALSTQMFNDRVTLNGNIGNNVNPNSTNNSQIVGDFEVNVKLIPSGKIQFKAYNRSNNNLIYETAPYTQGVGFSFKEEYNTIKELIKKLGQLFKRKNEND